MAKYSVTMDELYERINKIETTWQLLWTSGSARGLDAWEVPIPKAYKYIKIISCYGNNDKPRGKISTVLYEGTLEGFNNIGREEIFTKFEYYYTSLSNDFIGFNIAMKPNTQYTDNTYFIFGKLK